jgi:glycosyltransferase involved in cell wall biosynthesis
LENPLRIHLLGLPNAPVSEDFSLDGFAAAGHRFARMMRDLGHTVFLYGAEGSSAPCTEFINIMPDADRRRLLAGRPYQAAPVDGKTALYQQSNPWAVAEIAKRKQKRDFLLSIGGHSQKPVFDAHPDLMGVEYSIGYEGNFAPFRVFESHAWRHFCMGAQRVPTGRFFDTVIPTFFDPDQFPFNEPEDYFLYAGRLTFEKGVRVACDAATAAGVKLKIIGHGGDLRSIVGGHEYLGAPDWKTRNELMSRARAVFCPSLYWEPFGCVAVEAQLCGTPVISTDWGGYVETVEHGVTGFRCHYLGDFVEACRRVDELDRWNVRCRAIRKYSMHVIRHEYQRYFDRLSLLWERGWEMVTPPTC